MSPWQHTTLHPTLWIRPRGLRVCSPVPSGSSGTGRGWLNLRVVSPLCSPHACAGENPSRQVHTGPRGRGGAELDRPGEVNPLGGTEEEEEGEEGEEQECPGSGRVGRCDNTESEFLRRLSGLLCSKCLPRPPERAETNRPRNEAMSTEPWASLQGHLAPLGHGLPPGHRLPLHSTAPPR